MSFQIFLKINLVFFFGNDICFTELSSQYFLIFEKIQETHNLYVSKYKSNKEIGFHPPEIIELLIKNYDKSIPAHRVVIKRYLL